MFGHVSGSIPRTIACTHFVKKNICSLIIFSCEVQPVIRRGSTRFSFQCMCVFWNCTFCCS